MSALILTLALLSPIHADTEPIDYGWQVEQWRPWVEIYFQPWDVDHALRILKCESSGNVWAYNPSGASGLFQHMSRFWIDRSWRFGWGGWDIYSPDANVAIASHLVYDDSMGWAHWNASRRCWG